ncbi:hypothetical protein [Bacillus wiedmannii]|nr:hypothetical protein [Bacillus wiedmannii]
MSTILQARSISSSDTSYGRFAIKAIAVACWLRYVDDPCHAL